MADYDRDDPRYKKLLADILPMVEEIKRLNAEAVARGEFPDDRGMLDCASCGLMEDVAFNGKHLVYFKHSESEEDIGLRFRPTDDPAVFLCPSCNAKVYDPDAIEN